MNECCKILWEKTNGSIQNMCFEETFLIENIACREEWNGRLYD
jgi:hypothetical protein